MNSFWLLLLVHIIADFPLQTDYVFQLKQKKKWGVLLHGLIHFGISVIILFPYWENANFWIGLFIVSVSHILVDKYKLILEFSRSAISFLFFWLDQLIHILIIVLVSNFILKNLKVTIFFPFYQYFFFNTRLLIILCAGFFVIFGSTPFIYYGRLVWENIYPSKRELIVSFPSFRFRLFGYIERFFSIILVILGGNLALFFPGIFLARILYSWNKSQDRRYIVVNLIISIVFVLGFYWLFLSELNLILHSAFR